LTPNILLSLWYLFFIIFHFYSIEEVGSPSRAVRLPEPGSLLAGEHLLAEAAGCSREQPSCSPELAKLWRKGRNNLSLVSDHRIKLIISHKVYLYLPSKWMWTARNVYLRVIISLLNTEFSTNVFACEQASRLGEPNFFLFVRNGNSFTYIL